MKTDYKNKTRVEEDLRTIAAVKTRQVLWKYYPELELTDQVDSMLYLLKGKTEKGLCLEEAKK